MKLSLLPLLLATFLPAQQDPPRNQEEFFGLDKIWDVHLEVSPRAWALLFPEGGRRMSGNRFTYVGARIRIAGHEQMHIGLRFKGNSTYSGSVGTLKRSFKIDFNRFKKKQGFLGLTKLNLNNNTTDGTQIREAISFQTYREAGLPGSQTAFARVFLTIKGQVEKEYVGLYTMVEQADRGMFRRQLKDKVTILKPQGRLLAYYGEDWGESYERTYQPKTKIPKKHKRLLMRLSELSDYDQRQARTGSKKTEEQNAAFARSLERIMDVDGFLRYLAVTSILSNWDNPLNIAHNIYLIVPKKQNKIVWVPWDLNLSMSSGRFQGASVLNPRSRSLTIANSILAVPKYKKTYKDHVQKLIDGPCSAKAMTRKIEICRKTTNTAIAEEEKRSEIVMNAGAELGGGRRRSLATRFRTKADLVEVMTKREQAVRDELAGKPIPQPQRSNRRSRTRRVRLDNAGLLKGLMLVSGALAADKTYSKEQAVAASANALNAIDKDGSQKLDIQELRAITGEFIKKQGPRNPFASGPSTLARTLRPIMDTDKDRLVSGSEWSMACAEYFASWDSDSSGTLEAKELEVVLSR